MIEARQLWAMAKRAPRVCGRALVTLYRYTLFR
jgi:hypothetical protein